MNTTPNQNEALQKIRQKLYFCAALALRHNLDLSADLARIFGKEEPATTPQSLAETVSEKKAPVAIEHLKPREKLVLETIYESSKPVSINEMLDKFKVNRDTRCSRATLSNTINVLKALELIFYTQIDNKTGYLKRTNYGTSEP